MTQKERICRHLRHDFPRDTQNTCKILVVAKYILYSHSIGTIASSMIRINGCLYDSKKKKWKKKKQEENTQRKRCVFIEVFHFPQLIPEAYLPTPLLFPFPAHNPILGANAVHGITEDGRLVSHILPNEYCWFAQTGHAITRIPDGLVVRALLISTTTF